MDENRLKLLVAAAIADIDQENASAKEGGPQGGVVSGSETVSTQVGDYTGVDDEDISMVDVDDEEEIVPMHTHPSPEL